MHCDAWAKSGATSTVHNQDVNAKQTKKPQRVGPEMFGIRSALVD
jgi:hypothetical protein